MPVPSENAARAWGKECPAALAASCFAGARGPVDRQQRLQDAPHVPRALDRIARGAIRASFHGEVRDGGVNAPRRAPETALETVDARLLGHRFVIEQSAPVVSGGAERLE